MSDRYSIAAAFSYMRRPYFPAGRDPVREDALRHLAQLLGLSLLVVIVMSGVIGGIIASAMGDVPENVNATIGETNPAQLLMFAVFFAPLVEEVVFRSWLGGARACLIGLPVLMSLYAVAVAATAGVSPMVSFAVAGGLSVLVLAVGKRFSELSAPEQKAARWALFPAAFYGSAVLFGLLHLSNYEGGLSSPIMLLAVVPQTLVGLLLGYVRMRFGLGAAIIFHALYNLVLAGLFIVSQSLAGVADGAEAAALIVPLVWMFAPA
jgi:membrane protease YdiL (CAAX protease family)